MMAEKIKDPDATLDYTIDFSALLEDGETIASVEWEIAGDDDVLTLGTGDRAPSNSDTAATCWLSGGTLSATYTVTARVTTSASPARIDDRSFRVVIKQR